MITLKRSYDDDEEEEDAYEEHTVDNPFCSADPTCPCHDDPENIAEVDELYLEGLLTAQEATDTVNGKIL